MEQPKVSVIIPVYGVEKLLSAFMKIKYKLVNVGGILVKVI